ncbi:alpha-ketoglutarate-dependent taurine dioxygenase [Micromonospora sp. M71_S20]|uniref:TauD/TfdA family dioxygenase n=1 Tax=unclassified Micromonospora TaxID=2617518 RepID=UPI000EB2AFCB|nr:TauD/TfdA family dioxygenase [Micromonospora sp. M71_S20]RLK09945.1 alpha-ketoglutarate-dependent taurine dioxygenase [Micromonospora sp. M71_S20]
MNEHASWKPLEITPESAGCAPSAEGLVGHLRELDLAAVLTAEKALVFRGFGVRPETLDPVMDLLLPRRLAYVHGNSPRTKVGRNVYTSTEYPARYTISMHNELSYAARWPARLLFFCQIAAETGGATPVVDAALWLDSLDPQLRADFAGGLRYQQNLHDGMGLGKSWRETFETDSRDEVEEFLAGAGATWEWTADGLRVIQLRPATLRHPVTGAEVWFNQADQWHPAGLDDDIARVMTQVMGPDELPQSVTFADGSPIPDEYVTQIRDRGLEAAVDVDWRVGDLLLIDNVLTAHGRRPYTGDRRVLVAMSD